MKRDITIILFVLFILTTVTGFVHADVPGRPSPAGTSVPNPGAQQQELPNITFPFPYNVFEFPVTCMACHGGSIDQQAGHGGNWAGTAMASAMRDPVFRANQVIVNNTLKNATGQDGAGNLCFRCHSPNGWLSGRFDPKMGGFADGSNAIQSILLSTDTEGVSCEMCHRAVGAVTMKRADLNQTDPVWNMMSGATGEWPHAGSPYPAGPGAGEPYGDATLQYHDGMSYGGKYGGNTETSFNDLPLIFPGSTTNYTGQTYGIYPWWFTGTIIPNPPGMPQTDPNGDVIAYNPDGSITFLFEGGVMPDPLWGAVSPEHSTRINDFVMSSEFCGTCHEVTVPVLDHGMPEQRTYTEWKYSAYGRGETVPGVPDTRCQGCHMPTLRHEYADDAPVSLNPDPLLSGWYPYAKDRNIGGGTSFHKLAGANRDLPMMMKILYPEVDLEVIGAPTGHDPRIFPGMFSDRGPMWDRNQRNTEINLRDAVSAEITNGPVWNPATSRWDVTVRITNFAGHRVPWGYPDGRRMWIGLVVKNDLGNVVYQSGHYDPNEAKLYTDLSTVTLPPAQQLNRALTNTIDSASNAVMIYEKRTGVCDNPAIPTSCTMSESLLNDKILFDNRIPPLGYDYAEAGPLGGRFWNYDPATFVPYEDTGRYPDDVVTGYSRNWDEVTYSFTAAPSAVLTARAEVYYQSHSREFMDHLVSATNALPPADRGPRPEGPPNPFEPNYPLTPTYLIDSLAATTGEDLNNMTDLSGSPLQDNWAGIAYASWLLTGKGEPFAMAADDTAVTDVPNKPNILGVVSPIDPVTGLPDPAAHLITWMPVNTPAQRSAEGYILWIRYGASDLTADWDRLAVLPGINNTSFLNIGINVGKTYAYMVQAYNAKGLGTLSAAITGTTTQDAPLEPLNTRVIAVTDTTATLAWFDQADNEIGFMIERQELLTNGGLGPWVIIAYTLSATGGAAFGGNNWTDTNGLPLCIDVLNPPAGGCVTANWTQLLPGRTYNYQISAYNAVAASVPGLPAAATTTGAPPAPTNLAAVVITAHQVDLSWTDNSGGELGFRIERSTDGGLTWPDVFNVPTPNVTSFSDTTTAATTTYYYRVFAYNVVDSAPSNIATVTTPPVPPAAPSGLTATASLLGPNPPYIDLSWTDNATDETGFTIQRATDAAFTLNLTNIPAGTQTPGGTGINSLTDTGVAPKTTYWYRVLAFNGGGNSAFSNSASAVTPGEIPEAPSNLRIVGTPTKTSISIAWNDNSNNETGFYVERSTNGGGTWTRVKTLAINATSFKDSGLKTRTTYTYRVQAFNVDGVSAYTDPPVSATTR